jgi:hypothetical protein
MCWPHHSSRLLVLKKRVRAIAALAAAIFAAGMCWCQAQPANGPQNAPHPAQIDRNGVMILIRESLLALDQANKTGNYTVLRDLGAPAFQANSAARLSEIFAKQRNDNIDLSGVAVIDPQLTLLPQIEGNGLLHMTGFFPSVPTQVNFDLAYAAVNGQWRLFGISVALGRTEPVAPAPPKVMFATPCYISAVSMNYVASIFSLTCDAMHVGLDCILHLHSESLITRGRNNIVRKFLSEESFTHLFWIDSNIAFSADAVFRLLRADRDVAAGVYPMKNFHWPAEGLPAGMTRTEFEERYTEYPFNPIGHGNARVSGYADGDGFVEVDEAPTGFMAIKRHVFSRMMERYPQLRYTPDGPPGHPQAHLHWLFFDCMVHPETGRYLSEDFAFCQRAIGGKVWVDLECKLSHLGQHMFRGDLAQSLRVQGRW